MASWDESRRRLLSAIGDKIVPSTAPSRPVWRGPEEDGITYSLLSRFLVCRERFRLLVVEGLRPVEKFNHRIEYGQMWHTCEEAEERNERWEGPLLDHLRKLAAKYPTSVDQIQHWGNVCRLQFPLYLDYWARHPDETQRTFLYAEEAFCVPYRLPSGREVKLRGKWDSVDLIGKGRDAAVYLKENKTKGDVDEAKIKRQLTFDLQTMIYLTALIQRESLHSLGDRGRFNVAGVRYNVVRRPLSGGKGTIKQKAGETASEYYERLASYIRDEPHTYFARWKVEINEEDVRKFRRTCLDPILEQLCDWWDWMKHCLREGRDVFGLPHHDANRHWRHPFGVYNVMDEGGSSDLDEYLATGSEVGLERVEELFPELQKE